MTYTPIVAADRLVKEFAGTTKTRAVQALKDITLSIPPGQLTAFVGPDGAGKTTLLRLLCGLSQPTSGSLTVLGYDTAMHPQKVQASLSYMPQRFGLYEDLSVMENLRLYADLQGVPKPICRERFDKLLSLTELSPFTSRMAGKLSGGMKQKLGLACALVRTPRLLLLDEPTVGVDPLSRRELWQILQQLVEEERLSVIVSTAYMDEAERCQTVFVLCQGRLLDSGSPASLLRHAHGKCFVAAPPAGVPARMLQSALLDDDAIVLDAVPERGNVRFIAEASRLPELKACRQFSAFAPQLVPERLEDSIMILLRRAGKTDGCSGAFRLEYAEPRVPSSDIDIEIRDLTRRFGSFTAVDKTSFVVRRGEIFGLLGPNGAGKSTTFRMLCGLLPASSGFLSVAGVDLRRARAQARTNIGYVAQKFSLYATLSVLENLEFFGGAYGLRSRRLHRRIQAVAQQFGLEGLLDMPAGELPGGYKQRLSMAAALLHEPRILFLDEPTSGIDPLARRIFWKQITALAAQGTTVIVTTHFMEEAEYCDRLMIQDQGRMIAMGTPDEIRRRGHGATMNEAFIHIVEDVRRKEATAL